MARRVGVWDLVDGDTVVPVTEEEWHSLAALLPEFGRRFCRLDGVPVEWKAHGNYMDGTRKFAASRVDGGYLTRDERASLYLFFHGALAGLRAREGK